MKRLLFIYLCKCISVLLKTAGIDGVNGMLVSLYLYDVS